MGIGGALTIGRSGLLAAQAGIEVAGNNLANIATRGFHRQALTIAPNRGQEIAAGQFIGRGVQIIDIVRQVNEGIEARLRTGIANQSRADVQQTVLEQIEAIQSEFTDIDLSTHLAEFFNVWSQLANNPQDNSLRSLVVQEGKNLAAFIRTLDTELVDVRTQVDKQVDGAATAANSLLEKIQQLNSAVATAEGGQGTASGLRDERGVLLDELSTYLDISINELSSGAVDIFVGSTPVILNGQNLGLETRKTTVGNNLKIEVVLSSDGTVLDTSSGRIGALIAVREDDAVNAVNELNSFANTLIFEVNRIYSQGQGLRGFDTVTATNRVFDTAAALNDPLTQLDFTPVHGSFKFSVTQKSTDQRTTGTLDVDLDGIGVDTTLTDLQTALNAVAGVNASITSDGRLKIDSAASDFEFSFSDDTSGVLAALGINSFFTGADAGDININNVINNAPGLIAAAQGHLRGDNRNALALAGLRDQSLSSLGGLSLVESWNRHVEDYAGRLNQAQQQYQADTIVRENLESQQQRASGVNADEETINLLSFQRAYQSSARFISVVDELMQTLLSLV